MSIVELSFASGENSLSVRSFSVQESISGLFNIAIVARSPNDDIDFESIISQPAMLRIVSGVDWALAGTRLWTGICESMEQVRVEPNGLSTYELTIVPALWMLTQRRNNRLFQHISIPDIVERLLKEWNIEHVFHIDRTQYPKLELRVQYSESDYAFMSRLLEEAGISFYFSADDLMNGSQLVLHDKPQINELRGDAPIPFFDDPTLAQAARHDYLTDVRVGHKMRPGRLTIRDFDFRRPGFALYGESPVHPGLEEKLEQYHYMPGAFLTEGHAAGETPSADDKGVARFHQPAGHGMAKRVLESHRATKRLVHWKTNAMDLAPGVVFAIANHPRSDLSPESKLLVNSLTITGEINKEWTMTGTASFAAHPYRPQMVTQKPRIYGVQSAVVVGPKGETVYTDEFGRIRVQFHWDREGRFDENSSIWMRVSQAWAGPGYGMINLPRVGHEVLVGFLEGDPDSPIVVGRVFNGAQQVPYKLPDSKLMSAWKSDSASNIILFIDIPGHEGFLEQAEKDHLGVVKNDEAYLIGNKSAKAVRADEQVLIGGKFQTAVLGEHSLLSGGESGVVAKTTYQESAGEEILMTSGYKWEAGVQPIIPFIFASLAVSIAKETLDDTFPAGPPDLQAILAAQMAAMGGGAGGVPPDVSAVVGVPLAAAPALAELTDLKAVLQTLLVPLASVIKMLTPAQIQQILKGGPALDQLIQQIQKLAQQNQPPGAPPLPNLQPLMDKLKALLAGLMSKGTPGGAPRDTSGAEKKGKALAAVGKVLGLIAKITDLLGVELPGTGIKITPDKIELKTSGAKIELKKDSIEITAEGEIKIKGGSVSIEPSPCKCGGG